MNKKMGMILGGVGVVVVVILLIFLLSGNSTRDMIIDGKWETRKNRLNEFNDDGKLIRYFVREGGKLEVKDDDHKWVLSDDEKTITITGRYEPVTLIIHSIDNDELCLKNDENGDVKCIPKYSE